MPSSIARDRIGIVAAVVVLTLAFFVVSAPQKHDAPAAANLNADAPPPVTPIAVAEETPVEAAGEQHAATAGPETPPPPRPSHDPAPTPAATDRPTPPNDARDGTRPPDHERPPPPRRAERRPARVSRPSLTLEDYFKIMSDDRRTQNQREARLKPYTGQRLTWEGYVRQIRDGSPNGAAAQLLAISPVQERTWDLAMCWFDEVAGRELGRLKTGDHVIVTGTLEPPSGMGPVLRECHLGAPAD